MILQPPQRHMPWHTRWVGRAVWKFTPKMDQSNSVGFVFYDVPGINALMLYIQLEHVTTPSLSLDVWHKMCKGTKPLMRETPSCRLLLNPNRDKIEAILTRLYPGILFVWENYGI